MAAAGHFQAGVRVRENIYPYQVLGIGFAGSTGAPPVNETIKVYRLAAVGLSSRDERVIRSLLAVVAGKTAEAWEFTDELQADLTILQPGSVLAESLFRSQPKSGPMMFASRIGRDEEPIAGTLPVPMPMGATAFIDLLNFASVQLHAKAASSRAVPVLRAPPPPPPPRSTGLVTAASWGKSAIPLALEVGALLEQDPGPQWSVERVLVMECGAVTLLMVPHQSVFWALVGHKPAHFDAARLAALFAAPSFWKVEWRRHNAVAHIDAAAQPLQLLLWQLAMNASGGALLPELAERECRLLRWPDLRVVGADQSLYGPIIALLVGNPLTAPQLARSAGVPQTQAFALLNACALCRLIELGPRAQAMKADASRAGRAAIGMTPAAVLGLVRSMRTTLGRKA